MSFRSISCQYQFEHEQHQHQQNFIPSSHFPAHQHNFHIQHSHPTPTPTASSHHRHQNHNNFNSADQFRHQQQHQQQHHHSHHNHNHNQQQPSSAVQQNFNLDKFNQQTKQIQAQIHYLNQQQAKHIQQQINSVHQQNNEPHFDFIVNGNYSDLEKASEQFVNYGRLANKNPTSPKVIKITKTLAVKQPIPVPYPVPVVKVIKEQIPVETSHPGYHGLIGHSSSNSAPTTTQRPYEEISYVPHRPTKLPPHSAPTATSYQSFTSSTTASPSTTPSEYDTEPFYIRGPHKEMIKIVPVPYYVDEHGNKHEIKSSASSSSSPSQLSSHDSTNTNGHDYYTNLQQTAPSSSTLGGGGEGGKFNTYSYSYHPSSPQHQHQHQHHNNHAVYAHEAPSNPEEEYFYHHHENRDSEQGASESLHQHSYPSSETVELNQQQQELCSNDDFGDEYRYKYLTYDK